MLRSASQSPGYWNSAAETAAEWYKQARSEIGLSSIGIIIMQAHGWGWLLGQHSHLTKSLLVVDAALQTSNRENGVYFELVGCLTTIQP